ncbi:MAG: nucleotidyltransferase family protein [Halieaceae bacterium]
MIEAVNWRKAVISEHATFQQAFQNLNDVAIKLCICADEEGGLIGLITDGDLRRGLLRGLSMEDSVAEVINRNPLVVPENTDWTVVRALMRANKVAQVPSVDDEGHVVGLYLWDELGPSEDHDHVMVLMVGGLGKRLRPYTESCPKPMLEIAGKPMLQHIVERARNQGFRRFIFCLNYFGEMIRDFFGDGRQFGINVEYVEESEPLGTAGALSLISGVLTKNFVVSNGDVLTDIDYAELLSFLNQHGAKAVMAVKLHEWTNPFGVVEMDGLDITGFSEKPVMRSHVNAGVYALSPSALETLRAGEYCDMPTIFERLAAGGDRVVAYPMYEPWLDVGKPADLRLARRNSPTATESKSPI